VDAPAAAAALSAASDAAYAGVSEPKEGTMLTVIREAAAAAREAQAQEADFPGVMRAAVEEARASVARTPSLLPILQEAQVVDSGGAGVYFVLEGALRYVTDGGTMAPSIQWPEEWGAQQPRLERVQGTWGYCTEFVVRGEELNRGQMLDRLNELGQSTLVVGEPGSLRVHVHTEDPGAALSFGLTLGSLHQIKIENMQEQHVGVLSRRSTAPATGEIGIVAVVPGEGLMGVFQSLGATIIAGGETMNPSTRDILEAVDSLPSEEVVVLPNNKNVHMAAQQALSFTKKKLAVVLTRSIPEGIAALVAFQQGRSLSENLAAMEQARRRTKSGEVTTAARPTAWRRRRIETGTSIGFADDQLLAAAGTARETLLQLLKALRASEAELITIYWGGQETSSDAEATARRVRELYPDQEVELVWGGQPFDSYLVSVE
jgi:DAK2 domain fusion protein YloV